MNKLIKELNKIFHGYDVTKRSDDCISVSFGEEEILQIVEKGVFFYININHEKSKTVLGRSELLLFLKKFKSEEGL